MTVIQIEEQVVDATLVEQPDVAVTIVEGQSLPGPAGVGVPTGGTTGDFIRKLSDADFDTGWSHPDFVTSVATRTGDVVLGEADITGLTGDLTALVQADTDEAAARAAADSTNATAITTEATARAAADTTNANAIAAEVTRATAAEATKVATSDSRLSDARTPTAHHTTHESGGTDAVTLAQSQITGLVAALAALQPLDSDLTAIAALTTTSFGRALLALADAAALRSAAGVYSTGQVDTAIAAVTTTSIGAQPLDSDLTAIAALTTTSFGRAFLTLADAAAALTAIGAVATSDSRLTDARTPAAHHTTHESGGTDAVTLAQSQVTGLTTSLAGKSNALTRTTVKTSAYTAAAGDLVPVDTTSGAVTITLPTAPADKTRIAIKHIIQGGTNAVTYQCGGSDVLNKASGVTSGTLPILAMSVVLEYQSSTAIWSIVAGDTPVAQLDLRYPLTTDARLSDTRTPTDNSVTSAKIVDGTIVDGDIASANKDGLAATPSLRTLGTGSTQAAAGNDARLSDTRTPTDGTVTTAKIVDGAVTSAKIADGTITDTDVASANKDGVAATASLRTLGTGAQQAAAGNDARLSDTRTPTDGTVTTAKIVDANVTFAKLANMATASLLGRNTAGTGVPEVLSAATVRTLLSLVIGTDVQAWSARLDTLAGTSDTGTGSLVRGTAPTITQTVNNQTGTYTLVLGDASKIVALSTTPALVIPANASVAFATGTRIDFLNISAVSMTISITTDTLEGPTSVPAHRGGYLLKRASTVWCVVLSS